MTLFISIFSILMVILANHPTDSGAVPKTEVRLQRSLVEGHMKPSTRIRKVGKKHTNSKKNSKKSKKNQQNSAEKQTGKSQRKGRKSAKKAQSAKRKFMGGRKFDPNFEFRACDYLDLVEVGYS